MTNTLILVTQILTNWQNIPGDWRREDGTNYVRQRQVVVTNVYAEEVTPCTNRTLVRQTQGTNGPVRWEPVGIGSLMPGQFTKP